MGVPGADQVVGQAVALCLAVTGVLARRSLPASAAVAPARQGVAR